MKLHLKALQDATVFATQRGPGVTPPELREAVANGDPPEELAAFVEKIRRHAYRITDEEFDALRSRYDEDQLFELIVAASVGAADRRMQAGLRALEEATKT